MKAIALSVASILLLATPALSARVESLPGGGVVTIHPDGSAVILKDGKQTYVENFVPPKTPSVRQIQSGAVIHPDGSSSFYEVDRNGQGYVVHPDGSVSFIEPD
jgi:hypothetical protein